MVLVDCSNFGFESYTLNIVFQDLWCGCCWQPVLYSQAASSCAAMCPRTAVALRPRLVTYHHSVPLSIACTHTETYTYRHTNTHALAEITCFTGTLERGRRDVWQDLMVPFQLSTIQLPSKCQDVLHTHPRSKAQIYLRKDIKLP